MFTSAERENETRRNIQCSIAKDRETGGFHFHLHRRRNENIFLPSAKAYIESKEEEEEGQDN